MMSPTKKERISWRPLERTGPSKRQRRFAWMRGSSLALCLLLAALLGTTVEAGTPANPCRGRPVPDEGYAHVPTGSPIQYKHNPPTSGPHYPQIARPGVYLREILPGYWVHNLEHGYVVILYRWPGIPPQTLRDLQNIFHTFPKSKYGYVKLVIAPYPKLPKLLVAIAWTRILELDRLNRPCLEEFYRTYMDRGPEDAP